MDKEPIFKHNNYTLHHSLESDFNSQEELKSFIIEEPPNDTIKANELTILPKLNGRYQKLALTVLMVPALIAFFMIHFVFIINNTYDLLYFDKNTQEYKQSNIDEVCNNKGYNFECKHIPYINAVYYLFFIGLSFGLLLTFFADIAGRKTIITLIPVALCILYLVFNFVTGLFFCGALLVIGIVVGLYYCTSVVYITELSIPESTLNYVAGFHLSFPLAGAFIELTLHTFTNWKALTLIMALMSLVVLAFVGRLAESPCYLIVKGDYKAARIAANTITNYNTGHIYDWEFYSNTTSQNNSIWYLLQQEQIKKHFVLGVTFLCIGFSNSSLTQVVLKDNKIVLYIIEFIIILLISLFIQIIEHKKLIVLILIITSIITHFIGFIFIAKLSSSISFIITILIAAKLYPTKIKTTGLGISMLGSSIGAIVSKSFGEYNVLISLAGLCAIIFLLLIKEEEVNVVGDLECKELNSTEGAVFGVEGFCIVMGKKAELGIEAFRISARGELYWRGKDQYRDYSLTGSIRYGHKFSILKEYNNGTRISYVGKRYRKRVMGTYEIEGRKGDFEFTLKAKLWEGELKTETNSKKLEWVILQNKDVIHGLGEIDDIAYFITGRVLDHNRLSLMITTEEESEASFEGEIKEDVIQGKMSGFVVVLRNEVTDE